MRKSQSGFGLPEFIIALALLFLVGVIGYKVWGHQHKAKTATVAQTPNTLYVNQALGYQLSVPQGWGKFSTATGYTAGFKSPDGNATINVYAQPFEKITMTLPQFYESVIMPVKNDPTFRLIESGQKAVNGQQAYVYGDSQSDSSGGATEYVLLETSKNTYFIVGGKAKTADWPKYSAQVMKAILSFRP